MEKDAGKERGWEPYEPLGRDRPRLAAALRRNIVTCRLDGSEHIVRFMRGGRFNVQLPEDENLLKYATFDSLGTHRGEMRIRAFVSIPCPPDQPYRDTVEFTFVPEEWDMPRTVEHAAAEPAPVPKARNNVRYQAMAILAIGAAMFTAETTTGAVSWAKKKTRDVMEWIDENTAFGRPEPRTSHGGADDARQEFFTDGRVVDALKKLPQEPLDQ